MSLDENDINILHALQANGRLSFRQISEKVKVSVPTVSSKVNHMERMGVIRGYRADVDPERLGELSAVVTIKAKPADLPAIASLFEDSGAVRCIYHLSSGRLVLICTFVDAHLVNEFAAKLGGVPEVAEYEIANVISVVKETGRAVITNGLNVVVQCEQCGRDVRDQAIRLRDSGEDHYLCTPACLSAFQAGRGV